MSSKSFVKIITSKMKEKNMGVRQLARACGIDASFISKVIQGKRNPPTDEKIIKKLAAILLIDPTMLTIYTGRIPSSMQLILENESFVSGLMSNRQSIREKEKSPSLSGKKFVDAPASVLSPARKNQQKADITDELL